MPWGSSTRTGSAWAYNTRAIRCYRRAGFVEEGREREAAYVDGAWHDDVIMGILEHEAGTRVVM